MPKHIRFLIFVATFTLGSTSRADLPIVEIVEVVATGLATGNGGNAWGGHQNRIIRTSRGVFTICLLPGESGSRRWELKQRSERGWHTIAQGQAGQQPVHLLTDNRERLYVVAWPNRKAVLWIGQFNWRGRFTVSLRDVPNENATFGTYGATGINAEGENLALFSLANSYAPGSGSLAIYDIRHESWVRKTVTTDYRYCYTFLLPHQKDGWIAVATRDVPYKTLGYPVPRKPGDIFVFNAFAAWREGNKSNEQAEKLLEIEEPPSPGQSYALCSAQTDAFLDTSGRLHVIYRLAGPRTGNKEQKRHAIFDESGTTLFDGRIPDEAGKFCRIFQDAEQRFWLLGSAGLLFMLDEAGEGLGTPIILNLHAHQVEYSGFSIAAPRTGTKPSDTIDAIFPSADGTIAIYCRIKLPASTTQH